VVEKYPLSRFAPPSVIKLGDIYGFEDKDFELALEMYGSLIVSYPQSSLVPRALLRKAEIFKERRLDTTGSLEILERIYQKYPSFEDIDYVLLLMARCYEAEGNFTRERASLREIILEHPDSSFIEEANYHYGMACLGDGLVDEALLAFKSFLSNYPESRFAARAEIGYAEALKEKHGKSEALSYLASAVERYGRADRQIIKDRLEVLKSRVPISRIRIPGRKIGGRR
jgi:TolA-binding protein